MKQVDTIYFDMDGTIADLYGVNGWLEALRSENPLPYVKAKPLVDMRKLSHICSKLQTQGIKIGIITWLSKESSKDYKRQVRKAKKLWLQRHFPIQFDSVHMVQYGYSKRKTAKYKNSVLIDDDKGVRENWISKKNDRIALEPEKMFSYLENLLMKVS